MDRRGLGVEGEEAAVQFLKERGYLIRDRNVYCRYGELDVVAELNELLCFVEVRTRTTNRFGGPALTVMSSKQSRVIKAAIEYLQRMRVRDRMIRFDVISVVGRGSERRIEHIPNAFDAGM